MRLKNIKAFTLMEVMVSAVISLAITAGVYTTFMVGKKSWQNYSENVSLRQGLRNALVAMVSELREAREIVIVQDLETNTAITFYRPTVGRVSYTWRNSGDQADKIIRKNLLRSRVIAGNISALSFTRLKDTGILVNIAAGEKGDILRLEERVALRSQTGLLKSGNENYEALEK